MDLSQITYIGKTDFRNTLTQFGIRAKDRFRHMYIIGKSGTGKTTLIENLIVQDIYHGNGVAFIDPHGESADKILKYIPTSRIHDVIYFNPGDSEYPVAFNPMEISDNATAAERSLITDGLMTVFKKIWPDAFSGRMEYILNNTMLALLEYPEPSLLGINRMLTDKEYRKKVVMNVQDPTVRNAWDELNKWDDKRWSEAIGALVNKIGQFTTNPIVRNIIGQPKSTFNFRQVMDEKKILIMNMSKGLIGDQSAALLGAMLITKIYLAGMSRANMTAEQLEQAAPLYFYVDEFQNFANDSFANILSEARKYKLALIVANQYIAQMEETIRDAVFGNMGTTITFRLGPLDAEFVERVYAPVFTSEDLQNIAFGQIFLTLLIDGMASKPFSALTLPPIQPTEEPQRDRVIDESRRVYARTRKAVEEKIMAWFMEQRSFKNAQKSSDEKPIGESGVSGTGASRTYTAPVKKPVETVVVSALEIPPPIKPGFVNHVEEVISDTETEAELEDILGFDILVPVHESLPAAKPVAPVITSQKSVMPPVLQKTENNKPFLKKEFTKKPEQKFVKNTPYNNGIKNTSQTGPAVSSIKTSVKKPDEMIKLFIPKSVIPNKKPEQKIIKPEVQKTPLTIPVTQKPFIKKDFSKAAKSETKNALLELLQKTERERNKEVVQKQENIQQKDNEKPKALQQVLKKTKTNKERLEEIFQKSATYRGGDDLPEKKSDDGVVKEVPLRVLQDLFQSV